MTFTAKKALINVAQLESRADEQAHQATVLVLSQVITSKHKRVTALTQPLSIVGLPLITKKDLTQQLLDLFKKI